MELHRARPLCSPPREIPGSIDRSSLRVPFGRCADGIGRHVSAVADKNVGPFTCLDCEEPLSLRQPKAKRAHFAHRPGSQCSGEGVLHLYAKELLQRARCLTLPALALSEDGITKHVCDRGRFNFETVLIERAKGSYKPDATVMYNGIELAVEFKVTHAVDEAKRAKVVESGLSMVEIDLAGLGARDLDAAALDEAILHGSDRSWIFHRREQAARAELDKQIAAQRAAKGARLRFHIQRIPAPKIPKDWRDDARQTCEEAGLGHCIGLQVSCSHWFTVDAAIWQAELLAACVVRPARMYSPVREVAIKGSFPNEPWISSNLPAWMIRTDLSNYRSALLQGAGYDRNSFGTAEHAVRHYLQHLAFDGQAVDWSASGTGYIIEPELHGRLHRGMELHRRVSRLLAAAGNADPEAAFYRWMNRFRIGAVTPREAIAAGCEAYKQLDRRLHAIEGMAQWHGTVADDLCGLPLEMLRERTQQRQAAEEASLAQKLAEAGETRVRMVRRRTDELFGPAAVDRLHDVSLSGVEIETLARESDDGMKRAMLALEMEARRRNAELARQEVLESRRKSVRQVALRKFGDRERAELFLATTNPKLDNRRPIDFVESQAEMSTVLRLLQTF